MEKEILKQLEQATGLLREKADQRDKEAKEFGEATKETKESFDKVNESITALQKQLDGIASKANRRYATSGEKSDEQIEKDMKEKSAFLKFLRSGGRQDALTSEEKQVVQEVQMRHKGLVENSLGELIVPEDVDKEVAMAKHDSVIMRRLARVVQTSSDRMRRTMFNKLTAGYGKLETNVDNYDINKFESDIVPAQEWLHVHNLYGLTRIGEDQLQDSEFNLTQILTQMLAEAFTYTEGDAFWNGRGGQFEEPEGLLLDKRIKRYEVGDDTTLLDALLSLQYAPKDGQAKQDGVYVVNSKTELYTRSQKDENGNYMWQPPVQAGLPATLFGKSVYVDDSIKGDNAAVYGDIKRAYTIVDRQGMTLRRYDQSSSAMHNDLIPFRAKARNGGGVTTPEAVAILQTEVPELAGKLKLVEIKP